MCNMPCNSRVWLVLYNNMFARTRAHVMYGPKNILFIFKSRYYSYYAITLFATACKNKWFQRAECNRVYFSRAITLLQMGDCHAR